MRRRPSRLGRLVTRRRFIGAATTAVGLAVCGCRARHRERPNILWLIGEDLCPDLGCYGNQLVRTPNLDTLAAEGVRFDRAYVTSPVCSPARSALATGMYQTSIGAHNHRSHAPLASRVNQLSVVGGDDFRLPEGVKVFTHYFRRAGYHTSNVRAPAPGVLGTGKTDFNFCADHVFDGVDWKERQPGQPFYAQINFLVVHRPFRRFPGQPVDPAKVVLPPYYPDHPASREDWAMYYDNIQQLDVEVGKVLERLKHEDLMDNTIIFFFGDNGRPMPRGKEYLYEGGIRVPLLVRIPEKFQTEGGLPGSVRDDLVSMIDVTVSSLMLAGIEPPAHMVGRNIFRPDRQKRKYVFAARDRCDETVDRIRCVVGERIKYIRNFYPERPYSQPNVYRDAEYPILRLMRQLHEQGKLTDEQARFMSETRPREELYDLGVDPHELHNLSESPEHQDTLLRLRAVLDSWMEEFGDQGGLPEDPRVMLMPNEFENREQVDGWCTPNYTNCRLSRSGGVMKVHCSGTGSRNLILRSYVTEGGRMVFKFRARSSQVRPKTFGWDTVMDVANPRNQAPIHFVGDKAWNESSIAFNADGHLSQIRVDFGDAEGVFEFDWIRLYRKEGGQYQLVTEWDFP